MGFGKFLGEFYARARVAIASVNGGVGMKHIGLLIVLLFISAMFCYSEQKEFYREFRYRVVEEESPDTLKMKTPPMFITNSFSIIHEFRKVSSNKGLGGGGWKKMEVYKANIQPTYYDVENLFKQLPESWVEDGYRASLMPTVDNRRFWWEQDGSFHYYVAYRKINN
jgi:hypothetical protein